VRGVGSLNFPKKERVVCVLVIVDVGRWKRGRSVGRGVSESERVRRNIG